MRRRKVRSPEQARAEQRSHSRSRRDPRSNRSRTARRAWSLRRSRASHPGSRRTRQSTAGGTIDSQGRCAPRARPGARRRPPRGRERALLESAVGGNAELSAPVWDERGGCLSPLYRADRWRTGPSSRPWRARSGLGGAASAGLLGSCLLRRGLLPRRGRLAPRSGRSLGPPFGEQLAGAVDGDLLDAVALAQARVALAVSDVRPEPALPYDDRLAGRRVVAELAQGRGGRRTTSTR